MLLVRHVHYLSTMASAFALVHPRLAGVRIARTSLGTVFRSSSRPSIGTQARLLSAPAGPGHWEARTTRVKAPIPRVPNKKPVFTAAFVTMVVLWYVFSAHLNNRERMNSSVMRLLKSRVKESTEVHSLVGDPVNLERGVFGDPWINGEVRRC